jgi:hypothetical protein
MENSLISQAMKKVKVADHMLTQTYPLIKDPKILVAVVNNLFNGCNFAMNSVLDFERKYKRIHLFSSNFEQKYYLFKTKISPRYNFNKDTVRVIKILHDIVLEHKRAPIEFSRQDKFVICNENYRMRTINVSQIKNYINLGRLLVVHCGEIIE